MTDMTINGNWIMEKDEVVDGNLTVKGNILGKDGKRFNLTVKGNISARGDISAWDISAIGHISARNLSAWNISAGRDISYYAFCIAYKSIKCRSIKGQRENSFHRCLDGKIGV